MDIPEHLEEVFENFGEGMPDDGIVEHLVEGYEIDERDAKKMVRDVNKATEDALDTLHERLFDSEGSESRAEEAWSEYLGNFADAVGDLCNNKGIEVRASTASEKLATASQALEAVTGGSSDRAQEMVDRPEDMLDEVNTLMTKIDGAYREAQSKEEDPKALLKNLVRPKLVDLRDYMNDVIKNVDSVM